LSGKLGSSVGVLIEIPQSDTQNWNNCLPDARWEQWDGALLVFPLKLEKGKEFNCYSNLKSVLNEMEPLLTPGQS